MRITNGAGGETNHPEGVTDAPNGLKKWSLQEIQDILARKAFDAQSPYLRIDVTDIKDKLAQFRDLEIPRNPLVKRIKVPSVRANCSLTIWRKAGDTVVEQVRQCDIQSKTLPSGERWASIFLESPFEVPLEQLQADPERPSPFGEAPTFSMELKLMANNLKDAWPPLDLKRVPLSKMPHFYDDGDLVRLPILTAKWPRLPDIPRTPKEALLEMKAYQTSPSDLSKYVEYTPKLGLVVDIDWFETPSPLQQANEETRKMPLCRPPYASPEPRPETTGQTEWIFESILDKVTPRMYPAYHCPFCPLRHSSKEQRMKRFSSADEFCLHLRSNHSALQWKYEIKYHVDSKSDLVHEGKIYVRPCDEYDEPARGNKGSDPRELDWLRPRDPLDIEAFLKGDETWAGKKKRSSNAVVYPRHPDGPRSKPSEPARVETVLKRQPEDIPDIPQRPRRTFRVPKAPKGVWFVRNATKRALEEGEYISESDDDIDEEWLLQKHADTIDSFTDTSKEEKEFIHRFDRHMLLEDLASDLHASEALIRFCRQNQRWLRRDDMRLEFNKKLAALKLQGAISAQFIRACLEILNAGGNEALKTDAYGNRPNVLGEAPMKFNYGADPIQRGHIHGRCMRCQTLIRNPRQLVRCSNPTCLHPDFHLACIGLATRTANWRCRACPSYYNAWSSSPTIYPRPASTPSAAVMTASPLVTVASTLSREAPAGPVSSETPSARLSTSAAPSPVTTTRPVPPAAHLNTITIHDDSDLDEATKQRYEEDGSDASGMVLDELSGDEGSVRRRRSHRRRRSP